MRLKTILTSVTALLVTLCVSGQKLTRNVGTVPDAYNFWLYAPDGGEDAVKTPEDGDETGEHQKKPVFIFLHGASLCGNNLDKVRRYGTIDAIEKGRRIDGYVIAPQNPGGSWNPRKVMNILDWVEENYDVDKDRVYVLGMSLGGYGTIDVAASYPERIAAAMAICGGGTVGNLGALNELPLWIIHGTGDRAVSVKESDKVVSAMKKAMGGDTPRLAYDRIPGMNHSQPARIFYMPESYDWLLSHSLSDESRSIAQTFDVTFSSLRKAYEGLTRGKSGVSASRSKARASKSRARAAKAKARATRQNASARKKRASSKK